MVMRTELDPLYRDVLGIDVCYFDSLYYCLSIPVAVWPNAKVCGRRLAGVAVSNPAVGIAVVSVVFCQVEVSATERSVVQGSPTERVSSSWIAIKRKSNLLHLQ
jgi:hypothetical protein